MSQPHLLGFQILPGTPTSSTLRLYPVATARVRHTELVKTEDEDGLVDLEAQDLRLDKRQGLAVDLDQALAGLAVGDGGGRLLLAEALDALGGLDRHDGRCCRGKGVRSRGGKREWLSWSRGRVRTFVLAVLLRSLLGFLDWLGVRARAEAAAMGVLVSIRDDDDT